MQNPKSKIQNRKSKSKNSNNKKIFILGLSFLVLISACLPPDRQRFLMSAAYAENQTQPLNLNELIQEAKTNNPDILAAKKRWEASLARIPQAKSLSDPVMGFSFMKIENGTLKFDRVMPEDRMLSVSQMFPFFGKLPLKGKIALVQSQMAAAEYKAKELDIINALKRGYYDLFLNYKETVISEESLEYLKVIAKTAEAKYAVGDIPQEEVFKINIEIAGLSNSILNLKEERMAKETRINVLLNRKPDEPLAIASLEEDLSFNEETNSLYQLTLLNQPELLVFSYALEKNKYAHSLAKKSFLPDTMAQIGLRGFTSGGIGPWDLMLAFTVPFWFWTKQRYEVKEAIANVQQAQAAYNAMENKAFQKVKDLAIAIRVAKNKIQLYKTDLIPLLESSFNSSLSAFRSGKGNFMMLIDTLRMLLDTKLKYYKALVEYNMKLADLEETVGMDPKEVRK